MSDIPAELLTFRRDAADILTYIMMQRHDKMWATSLAQDPSRLRQFQRWDSGGVPWNIMDEGHRFKLFTMLEIPEGEIGV